MARGFLLCGFGTWDAGGLGGCSEGQDARLGFALLVLGHHVHLVVRVPLQPAQQHVIAAVGDADLWLPDRALLLKTERWEGQEGHRHNPDSNLMEYNPISNLLSKTLPPRTHRLVSDQEVLDGQPAVVLLDPVDLEAIAPVVELGF